MAPRAGCTWPTGQAMQPLLPDDDWKVPTSHETHTSSPAMGLKRPRRTRGTHPALARSRPCTHTRRWRAAHGRRGTRRRLSRCRAPLLRAARHTRTRRARACPARASRRPRR
eukprot:6913096-Prymnesium_polylepis.1